DALVADPRNALQAAGTCLQTLLLRPRRGEGLLDLLQGRFQALQNTTEVGSHRAGPPRTLGQAVWAVLFLRDHRFSVRLAPPQTLQLRPLGSRRLPQRRTPLSDKAGRHQGILFVCLGAPSPPVGPL